MLFLSLRTSFWKFWVPILCHIWVLFWAFGHLGGFLRIALPCRRELKNQGPGITEIAQKSNNKCIWLWDCFGKQVFKENTNFGSKTAPKGSPNWNLSWPGAPHELLIFSLGSTWLPKWCPMAPKVAPRVPKGCQNEEKMPSKASKCGSKTSRKKRSSNESVSVREQGRGRGRSRRKGRGHATANRDIETNSYPSPNGGPSSKVYTTKHKQIFQ